MGFGKKRSNKVGVGAITTSKKKLFAEGGMMDDGKNVDPVSGNDVPVGSLAEEVRDDVDAKLSPGEFVFPADVVRFIGLERLMQMRDQAKKGLMRMNDIGQMGNAEEAGEKADDAYEEGEEEDDNFESDIDEIMKEVDQEEVGRQTEQAFNTGGFVNPSYYDIAKAPKNPALDIRYFKDSAGKDFYMPFINGKPMKPMPNNATQSSGPPPKTSGGGTGEGGGAGGGGGPGAGAGALVPSPLGGILDTNKPSDTVTTTPKTVGETWGTQDVYGTYTGENLADFGRADMIYNPGGSGPSGEIMTEDLWTSSVSNANVKLGTTVLSALASAMGVPGILTMPFRLAVNKFGADKANAWLGEANRRTVARGAGIDPSTPEGTAAAASLVDRTADREPIKGEVTVRGETRQYEFNPQPAATPGAIGTGGIAANASSAVSDALRGTGLSDDQIGSFAQRAADSVVRGTDINAAVNSAKAAAVDAIHATEAGSYMSKEEIENAIFNKPSTTSSATEEKIKGFDPSLFELRVPGMEDYYRNLDDLSGTMGGGLGEDDFGSFNDFAATPEPFEFTSDDALFGDFWGTMDEEEPPSDDEEGFGFGSSMAPPSPLIDIINMLKRQESQER